MTKGDIRKVRRILLLARSNDDDVSALIAMLAVQLLVKWDKAYVVREKE
jgi:hypothetical protein